jgi:hypothetical protein
MVVVMPTFSKSKNGNQPVISAFVFGVEAPGSKHVVDRIDGKCGVVKHNGGHKKSPNEHLHVGQPGQGIKP